MRPWTMQLSMDAFLGNKLNLNVQFEPPVLYDPVNQFPVQYESPKAHTCTCTDDPQFFCISFRGDWSMHLVIINN